ncbi:MAG: histidine triad nucleotide-binding protein [Gammaproteobacteria bacterium]|nr:histidine triad nucleotide-binding protein [Gammaproteobacteria bacterium]
MTDTIFTKIINKEIPANIIFEDELCIIIEDISPQAPLHYLAIPKKEIIGVSDLDCNDNDIMGHLMLTIKKQMQNINVSNYRLVINNGSEAGQTIFHLHIHILANRTLGWPPG